MKKNSKTTINFRQKDNEEMHGKKAFRLRELEERETVQALRIYFKKNEDKRERERTEGDSAF